MGRGKHQSSLDLIEAAKNILEEIQPATVRGVAYKLFAAGVTPNMEKPAVRRVSNQLTWAREHGHVPWQWVVDELREPERVSSWSDPSSYYDSVRRSYRKDLWTMQPELVEVWSEKNTIGGVLAPVLDRYGVTFRVMRGFGSATAVHDAAVDSQLRPFTVLYVGDYDCSGMHMSEVDLPNRFARYGASIDLVRIALLPGDLPELPAFDAATKRRDPRYRWYVSRFGNRCWELDAMSPVELRTRVEAEIARRIDWDSWALAERTEAAEIETIGHVIDRWQRVIRDQGQQ